MKKFIVFILFLPVAAFSQKLQENKIDEFTHQKVLLTSWETIVHRSGGHMIAKVRMSKTDELVMLNFKMMNIGGTIAKGAELMLKMDDDSIITLHNLSYQESCLGCAANGLFGIESPGFVLRFPIRQQQRQYLLSHKIEKIRIYLTTGYVEEVVKNKHSAVISDELKLLD